MSFAYDLVLKCYPPKPTWQLRKTCLFDWIERGSWSSQEFAHCHVTFCVVFHVGGTLRPSRLGFRRLQRLNCSASIMNALQLMEFSCAKVAMRNGNAIEAPWNLQKILFQFLYSFHILPMTCYFVLFRNIIDRPMYMDSIRLIKSPLEGL